MKTAGDWYCSSFPHTRCCCPEPICRARTNHILLGAVRNIIVVERKQVSYACYSISRCNRVCVDRYDSRPLAIQKKNTRRTKQQQQQDSTQWTCTYISGFAHTPLYILCYVYKTYNVSSRAAHTHTMYLMKRKPPCGAIDLRESVRQFTIGCGNCIERVFCCLHRARVHTQHKSRQIGRRPWMCQVVCDDECARNSRESEEESAVAAAAKNNRRAGMTHVSVCCSAYSIVKQLHFLPSLSGVPGRAMPEY